MFTAAQAAQKKRNPPLWAGWVFTAAQAAQKSRSALLLIMLHVHCRTGSSEKTRNEGGKQCRVHCRTGSSESFAM